MKEETKKIFSASDVGVLIEDLEGQVKALADGIIAVDGKVDRGFADVNSRLSSIELRLDSIEFRLDKIEAELAYINAEVSELKTIFTKKADLDRLVLLEEKVAKLEKMVMEK